MLHLHNTYTNNISYCAMTVHFSTTDYLLVQLCEFGYYGHDNPKIILLALPNHTVQKISDIDLCR